MSQQLRERIVHRLLIPLWKGIDSNYKSNYRSNIWEQFEDNVRSAARAQTLSLFYSNLCKKMSIAVHQKDAAKVSAELSSGDDRIILKILRDETPTLLVMVQVENEQRRDEWKREHETIEETTAKGEGDDTDTTALF